MNSITELLLSSMDNSSRTMNKVDNKYIFDKEKIFFYERMDIKIKYVPRKPNSHHLTPKVERNIRTMDGWRQSKQQRNNKKRGL